MAKTLKRNILVVNLDPAAEKFRYECSVDIRDLISIDDVMELTKLGPNGGLVYAMEYLIENMDWFTDAIGSLSEEDYVLFDCPGQLELYTHLDLMRRVINALKRTGFSLCSVCLVDSTFLVDEPKFYSGILMALSTMMSLELPHLTVLSKCDLVEDKTNLSKFLNADYKQKKVDFDDISHIEEFRNETQGGAKTGGEGSRFESRYKKLSNSIKQIVEDFSLISMLPLDIKDEETITDIIYHCDQVIQFGESQEPDEQAYLHAEDKLNEAREGGGQEDGDYDDQE